MERSRLTAAGALSASQKFKDHPSRISAFSDVVTMVSVIAGNIIRSQQIGADAYRDRLLTDVLVNGAPDVPGMPRFSGREFESPNDVHRSVHVQNATDRVRQAVP